MAEAGTTVPSWLRALRKHQLSCLVTSASLQSHSAATSSAALGMDAPSDQVMLVAQFRRQSARN